MKTRKILGKMRSKRLFIGVPLSEGVKEKIEPIFQKLKETGADLLLVPLENLHLTVKFMGEVEEGKIQEIVDPLKDLASSQKEFALKLDQIGVFPSLQMINVIWIGGKSKEFTQLMKETNRLLKGFRENEHEEVPHLTLARVKSGKNKEKLQQLIPNLPFLANLVVTKFVLYESELTPQGPKYKIIEEFELS